MISDKLLQLLENEINTCVENHCEDAVENNIALRDMLLTLRIDK